jgi:hypothetical protein
VTVTYQSALSELLLVALDLPPRQGETRKWLRSHNLTMEFEVDTNMIIGEGLTLQGQNLLNNTNTHFARLLDGLRDTGQLTPGRSDSDKKEDHDTKQQGRDGGESERLNQAEIKRLEASGAFGGKGNARRSSGTQSSRQKGSTSTQGPSHRKL